MLLVPALGGAPGVDEAGGLRVVPEGGFGPVLPPELVVEGAREGPGDLGASEVVLLKDLVVPPATVEVGSCSET